MSTRTGQLQFAPVDSIMAVRQMYALRARIEHDPGEGAPPDPETGAPDQYQQYEVRYASGRRAGVPGAEDAARWREAAIADGVLVDGAEDA